MSSQGNSSLRLLRPLLRGLPVIILCLILAVKIAQKFLKYATPKYESAAKMRLADNNEGPTSTILYKDFDVFTNKNKIGAEIEVIQSNSVINKALNKLDFETEIYRIGKVKTSELYNDSPILIDYKNLPYDFYEKFYFIKVISSEEYKVSTSQETPGIKHSFGDSVKYGKGYLRITKNDSLLQQKANTKLIDLYKIKIRDRAKLIKEVSSNLDIVSIDKDIAILRVGYQSTVPEKAAKLVNQLCESYIEDYIEDKYKATDLTVKFLADQLDLVRGKLSQSEIDIESYRNQKNVINIRQETETDLRKIAQMKIQLSNLKMNLSAIDSLYNYVKSGEDNFLALAPNFEAFNDLLSTEIIKNLKVLQAERNELLSTYTEEETKVKVINQKILDLSSYLIESIKNTKQNLEIKHNQIALAIEKAEEAFIGVPTKEKELTILEREFGLNQKLYTFLHEKHTEAEIARAATISFHRIISRGEIPSKPVSPNKTLITFVCGILGLGFGVASILIVHSLKAKVNDVYTIEKNSELPIGIEIPKYINPSNISRGFQQIGIKLELKEFFTPGKIVCVSSFKRSDGNSFFSKHLTKSLKKRGFNVELVDAYDTHFDRDDQRLIFKDLSPSTIKIIDNVPVDDDNYAIMLMSAADVNLFILDSRLTPAKRIMEFNLLHEEYNLPNTFFGLNRAEYNPSLIKLVFRKGLRLIRKYYNPILVLLRLKKVVK